MHCELRHREYKQTYCILCPIKNAEHLVNLLLGLWQNKWGLGEHVITRVATGWQ